MSRQEDPSHPSRESSSVSIGGGHLGARELIMVPIENEPLVDAATVCRELNLTEAKLRKHVHLGTVTPAVSRGSVQKFWISAVRRDLKLVSNLREERIRNEQRT